MYPILVIVPTKILRSLKALIYADKRIETISAPRILLLLQEDFYNRLKSIVAILNPMIIVSLGGIVGFMVISILLAVFSLSDVH